ncbi:hypothetical protein NN561_018943 [Cricetulus griseus]
MGGRGSARVCPLPAALRHYRSTLFRAPGPGRRGVRAAGRRAQLGPGAARAQAVPRLAEEARILLEPQLPPVRPVACLDAEVTQDSKPGRKVEARLGLWKLKRSVQACSLHDIKLFFPSTGRGDPALGQTGHGERSCRINYKGQAILLQLAELEVCPN